MSILKVVQVPAAVAARLGPFLRRMDPKTWARAQKALEKNGITGIRNVDDLVRYMKDNPLASASILWMLADVGMAVSDMFGPEEKQDMEVRQFATELAMRELKAVNAVISGGAEASQALAGLAGENQQNVKALINICDWARAHYGSIAAAKDAFIKHQAFFELSKEDVDFGMDLL